MRSQPILLKSLIDLRASNHLITKPLLISSGRFVFFLNVAGKSNFENTYLNGKFDSALLLAAMNKDFEKFPKDEGKLSTRMKSVGEVMALGSCFQEALQKAMRSLELGSYGFNERLDVRDDSSKHKIIEKITAPSWDRLWYLGDAFRIGFSVADLYDLCQIDTWFLTELEEIIRMREALKDLSLDAIDTALMRHYKQKGFADADMAQVLSVTEQQVRSLRLSQSVTPVYKRIDSCAAEFPSQTAYMYSCYMDFDESKVSDRQKVMVLGSGPNRIGQGIEFDYCCVHAALAAKTMGYETIMVNCNPETVSTDPSVSDRLYFEPLTLEDVLAIVALEKPMGVVLQFGGQTPLKLTAGLQEAGVPILGTSPQAIFAAEDRESFQALLAELEIQQPPGGIIRSVEEGMRLAKVFAYPLMVRPSFVLGGRAMKVIYKESELVEYLKTCEHVSESQPLLLDHFLSNAIEVDVDVIADGHEVYIAGVLEHIERAGVHSGDSSCTMPPQSLSQEILRKIESEVKAIALALEVKGLMNVQFAVQDNELYVLEVNPRASRTTPFVAKTTGVPVAQVATRVMLGQTLAKIKPPVCHFPYVTVKKVVFPFDRFDGVDPILGPEMRSTGEVMGVGKNAGEAFYKAQLATNTELPESGTAFISVRDADKSDAIVLAEQFLNYGFKIIATAGTYQSLKHAGLEVSSVFKVGEGRPHIVDAIKNNEVQFIINTTDGDRAIKDSFMIRRNALEHGTCYTTTLAGARAACDAFACQNQWDIVCLQHFNCVNNIQEVL